MNTLDSITNLKQVSPEAQVLSRKDRWLPFKKVFIKIKVAILQKDVVRFGELGSFRRHSILRRAWAVMDFVCVFSKVSDHAFMIPEAVECFSFVVEKFV